MNISHSLSNALQSLNNLYVILKLFIMEISNKYVS